MFKSLQTSVLLSLLLGLLVSTAVAQRPGRGPRQSGKSRPRRAADRLKAGDLAPNFTLSSPDGKQTITLRDYRGKKPVALVFGSYT